MLKKPFLLRYLLVGMSPMLFFNECVTTNGEILTYYDVVLVNDSDFNVEDYAGSGPIKSGDSINISIQVPRMGSPQTAKNCCHDSRFFSRNVFTHNYPDSLMIPPFPDLGIGPRYSKADVKFDRSHCVYYNEYQGHYNPANYEKMDLGESHIQITYRITNKVFLQVEACRPIQKL